MADVTSCDSYCGDERQQLSFYRIPRQLVTGEAFRRLSTDAKLLCYSQLRRVAGAFR